VALAEPAIVPPPKVWAVVWADAALAVWAARVLPVLAIFVNLLAFLARGMQSLTHWFLTGLPGWKGTRATNPVRAGNIQTFHFRIHFRSFLSRNKL